MQSKAKLPPLSILETDIQSLTGLRLGRVSSRGESAYWNTVIDEYHYLGYKPFVGAQVRYLIRWDGGDLGAIGFSEAGHKVVLCVQDTTEMDFTGRKLKGQVEIYFKVLKSGCKIEDRQLETAERIKPCIALYMIVAWRVLFVTMLGRECPEMPCSVLFEDDEWKAVYVVSQNKPRNTITRTSRKRNKKEKGGNKGNRRKKQNPYSRSGGL